MGLHIVNMFQISSAPNMPYKLPRPAGGHQIPKNRKATRAMLDISIPVTNGTGGAATIKAGDVKSFLGCLLASVTTSFGIKNVEIVDNAEPADRLRQLLRDLTGDDFLVQDLTTGEWKELNTLTDATAVSGSINNTASGTIRVSVARAFVMELLGHGARRSRCPGSSQLSAFGLEGIRGSTFSSYTAGWSQNGNADVVVMFDLVPSRNDDWHPVPRYVHSEEAGQFQIVRGGHLIRAYERTYPIATTTLNEVTIEGADGEKFQGPASISRIQQDMGYRLPAGYESLATVWTPLFSAQDGDELEDLPLSSSFKFRQEGSAVINPAKFTALIVPHADAAWVEGAAKNLPDLEIGREAKTPDVAHIVNADASRDPNIATSRAATSGFRILPPDARDSALTAGLRVSKGGSVREEIPEVVKTQAKAAATIAGAGSKQAVQAVAERAAKVIPGMLLARPTGGANVAGTVIARKLA